MNHLITITPRQIGGLQQQSVNARELWQFVESSQQFADWIKSRIEKYGFIENDDFILHKFMKVQLEGDREVQRPVIDYHLTIDTAKELAMVEANDKGRQVRKYFIECERQAKAAHEARITSQNEYGSIHSRYERRLLRYAGAPDRMTNSLINRRASEMAQQMTPGIRRFLREKIDYEQQLALHNGQRDVDSVRFIADVMSDCFLEEVIRDIYDNI